MDYKVTFQDGSEALAHHGVKGMKWGRRKKLDKKMLQEDIAYVRRPGDSRGRAKKIAKNTQKRMDKKGESHSVVRKKATRNSYLKSIAFSAAWAGGILALSNPKIRAKAKKGAFTLGKMVGKTEVNAKSAASTVSKVMNKNIIDVSPISSSRGSDIVRKLLTA